jgi:GPH family glycoside/pentoside/hexuronide:cation symporter
MQAKTVEGAPAKPLVYGLGYKVAWGVAALGTSFITGAFGALLPIFYQDYLGLSAVWIGLASTIFAVWNAINDPIFGYISDATRLKQGRRIPYMRFGAPFLAVFFIIIWFAPAGAAQPTLFAWMLGSMFLYDTAYTVVGLAYSALLPEITESDAERNGFQISSSLFGLAGMILGFLVPDMFRPRAGTSPSLAPLQTAMIAVGIFCAAMILITAFVIKERPEFHLVDKPLKLGAAIRATFTSRSFIVFVIANFMSIFMSSLLLGAIFYLADYVLHLPAINILVFLFVPLIIGVPITTLIRRRLGVVGTEQLLLTIAGIGLILMTFVPDNMILYCLALAGFGLAGPQTLSNVLLAEVADEDELRSGVRREGAFFGINALITKPAQSLAIAIIPIVLEAGSFVTRQQNLGQVFLNQPASAIFGIKALVGLIPGIAMLLGAAILIVFPLRRERLSQVQQEVLRLHAVKEQRLEEMRGQDESAA